eukprot:5746853-Pyramimonas_sp.AAC.1
MGTAWRPTTRDTAAEHTRCSAESKQHNTPTRSCLRWRVSAGPPHSARPSTDGPALPEQLR